MSEAFTQVEGGPLDQVEHAIADAQMRHGEARPVGDVFRAEHVAIEGAHHIDVADAQNQVVDIANPDLCHPLS